MGRGKLWTDEEKELLSSYLGLKSYGEIGKMLNRSSKAVKLMAYKNNMTYFSCSNFYSANLLAQELGKSRWFIIHRHLKGHIKGKQATWYCRGKRPFIFIEENIVSFLRQFYYLFKVNRIPNLYFRNIVKEAAGG